jgi:glutamate-5-semialdehyde dehydrogenase
MNSDESKNPDSVRALAQRARDASRTLGHMPTAAKDRALSAMADALLAGRDALLRANAEDLAEAERNGLSRAMLDRLALNEQRVASMADAIREVVAQPDPVGEVSERSLRPNGMSVERVRIPLGVILMIYEARPNATAEAAALCVKSGNAVLLRGGKEALRSNRVIAGALRDGLRAGSLPEASVQLIENTERTLLAELLGYDDLIDLCIPRGGQGLIEFVREHATMPVVRHAQGVCHVFVHAAADLDMAEPLVVNSKAIRPGVCNAAECLLVDRTLMPNGVVRLGRALSKAGVELRADSESFQALERESVPVQKARADDYGREFLDKIMAVKVVSGLDEALEHIARFGTGHTETIVTQDVKASERFVREVVASGVLVNASTRLNDGGCLGLGAEIGISTSRLHAYGPMGLRELTTRKFVVRGNGQLRE